MQVEQDERRTSGHKTKCVYCVVLVACFYLFDVGGFEIVKL